MAEVTKVSRLKALIGSRWKPAPFEVKIPNTEFADTPLGLRLLNSNETAAADHRAYTWIREHYNIKSDKDLQSNDKLVVALHYAEQCERLAVALVDPETGDNLFSNGAAVGDRLGRLAVDYLIMKLAEYTMESSPSLNTMTKDEADAICEALGKGQSPAAYRSRWSGTGRTTLLLLLDCMAARLVKSSGTTS